MMNAKRANQWLAARLYLMEVADSLRDESPRISASLDAVAEHIKKCVFAPDPYVSGFGMTRLSIPPVSIDHAFRWANTGILDHMSRANSTIGTNIARFFS